MPSKKKKYNARFPAGRIKKIMQTDEEIGKVAQAVPVIISRTLELFVESLLKRAMQITIAKNAKTLTPTHMKQCILSESRFDFLKDLVKGIPDVSSGDDDFVTPSGNLSPRTPLSGRVYGAYSCFQFLQNDSSSSRSSGPPSQPSPLPQPEQPKFYKEIPIGSEDFDSRSDENKASSTVCNAVGVDGGTTVIQQLANHCPSIPPPVVKAEGNFGTPSLLRTISGQNITQLNELKLSSNCSKTSGYNKPSSEKGDGVKEEEEEEEEEEEQQQQRQLIEGNGYHIAKTCVIDEDYDT